MSNSTRVGPWLGRLIALLSVALAMPFVLTAQASPAMAAATGRVIAQPCLNLRTAANSGAAVLGCIPYNTTIAISCTERGSSVTGQCTSFVAWRLNNVNGVAFHNWYGGVNFGNANSWASAAQRIGIRVDGTPRRGSVAWSPAGTYGHVAWVAAVHGDGTITIEDYNHNWAGQYSTRRVAVNSYQYIHIRDL